MAQYTIKYDVYVHTEHYKYTVYSKMYGVYVWSHFWDPHKFQLKFLFMYFWMRSTTLDGTSPLSRS